MSTPILSVVVPVYREPLELPRLLAYLAACPRIEECEVIVVDGDEGSSRCPAGVLPVRLVNCPPGRGRQLNAGAAHASGEMLLFLHVDTLPPRRFVSLIKEALANAPAGAFDLSIRSSNPIVRLISASGMVRSRVTRIPYGDQAHFFRTLSFADVEGYPETPIMEDVVIMDRFKAAGASIAIVGAAARTSDRRWRRGGAVRTTLRNRRLMMAFRAGISAHKLTGRYPPQATIEPAREAIIVFYRALRENGVKTRLASGIGARRALELYEACVTDLQRELARTEVYVAPFIDEANCGIDLFAKKRLPGRLHRRVVPDAGGTPQVGVTLWDRMDDAFRRCFAAGIERAVLVGSDIPELREKTLTEAIRSLRRHDAVLGETRDGGFYLIGFCRHRYRSSLLYAGASEDGANAGTATAKAIEASGHRWAHMPRLGDLDTAADLRALEENPDRLGKHLAKAVSSKPPQ